MKTYSIFPISLWISASDKSNMTYFSNLGQSIGITGYIWYIQGTQEKIIVDSGGDIDYLNTIGLVAYPLQTLDGGLQKVGLTVNDVDLIIQTHLHSDHAAFASRFPKARVMVQKRELEFARNPHPVWAGLYVRKLFDGLNFEEIDGDFQIAEGLKILFSPGHTPGSQSVSINTASGTAVIAGLCSIKDNFKTVTHPDGATMPVTPATIHTHLFDAYDSMVRIKNTADIVLPLHDPAFIVESVIS